MCDACQTSTDGQPRALRRVSFPVPTLPPALQDKIGTIGAGGIAGYIATGTPTGQTTWALVTLGIAMLATEAVQHCRRRI
jgi:xanthine dehydrogenase iron-sulfur cluster and FAD-binding subunit A